MVENAQTDKIDLVADRQDARDAGVPPAGETSDASADQAHAGTGPLKYTRFDDAPGSTHNLVVSLVPAGARVLEVGAATGYMSEVLRERLGCTVVAVEIDAGAAALADGRADRVVVADADADGWEHELGDERFDVVLFADVLEHLRDPRRALLRVRPLLADGGAVVASVPNVAHLSVRLALLAGEFEYRETGLLDAAHLRFFTRRSLGDLFEGSGFAVSRWLRTRRTLEQSEVKVPGGRALDARELAADDPEASTYQFVVRAVAAEHAVVLAEARRAAREREAELAGAADELRGALLEREAALEAALRELSDERVALLAAERAVRERDETVDRLAEQVERLTAAGDELLGELAAARAAHDRRTLVRLRRELAGLPAARALLGNLRARRG